MNPATRLKLIRDYMRFGERYSSHQLYAIYSRTLDEDRFISHRKVSYKTIRDQLRKTVNSDSWLSQEDGLYFKTEPKCYFARLHEWLRSKDKWAALLTSIKVRS